MPAGGGLPVVAIGNGRLFFGSPTPATRRRIAFPGALTRRICAMRPVRRSSSTEVSGRDISLNHTAARGTQWELPRNTAHWQAIESTVTPTVAQRGFGKG
jgi:hypothetical protein